MSRNSPAELLSKAEAEYRREIEAAKLKLKARKEAIEWMRQETAEEGNGTIVNAIREVVRQLSGKFTRSDVESRLVQETESQVVSKALSKLVEEGLIEVAEPGRGRRGTVYARTTGGLSLTG